MIVKPGATFVIPQVVSSMSSSVSTGFAAGINQLKNQNVLGAAQSIGSGFGKAFSTGFGAVLQTTAQTTFINEFDAIQKQNLNVAKKNEAINNLITRSAATTDAALHRVINTQQLQGMTTEQVTAAIHAQNVAWKKAQITAIAANIALTVGITLLVSAFTKSVQAAKQAREAARDAATDFSLVSEETEEAVKKYDELNDVILDSSSSTEELNAAKDDLLALQKSLIDTYGDEVEGLDLVNGRYEEQIQIIKRLREEKAKDFIREHKYQMDKTSATMNEAYEPVVFTGVTFDGFNDELKNAINSFDERYNSFSFEKNDSGLSTARIKTTVKDGRETLEAMYDEFEALLNYTENDFEKQFVDNMLTTISQSLSKWEEEYEDDLESYKQYGDALATVSDNYIAARNENSIMENMDVSDIYEGYDDAIAAYNEALANGTDEEITIAEGRLDYMRGLVETVKSMIPNFDNLNEDQVNALIDAFEALDLEINDVLANERRFEKDFDSMMNGNTVLSYHSSTPDGGVQLVSKDTIDSIKAMNMAQSEFESYLHSDAGAEMFNKLKAAADEYDVELDIIISKLANKGIFTDIRTEAIDTAQTLNDAIKSVTDGLGNIESDIKDLGGALSEFQDDGIVSVDTLSGLSESFGGLESFGQFVMTMSSSKTTIEEARLAVNNLGKEYIEQTTNLDKLTEANAALVVMRLKDIGVANAQEVVERRLLAARVKEKIATAETVDEKWKLIDALIEEEAASIEDANAMEALRLAQFQLKLASIDVSNVSGDVVSGLLAQAKAAGIATESLGALITAQRWMAAAENATGTNKENMLAVAANYVAQYQRDFDPDDIDVDFTMPTKYSSGGSGSGSKTEKYLADIDELYKALERQKEIEEDITDIKRKREGLEEDDFTGQIISINDEISALERLNETLHEQNQIRRSMINQNISDLQKYGFIISYNSSYNELLIDNYEKLNTLVTAYANKLGYSADKTNELIKSVEDLISETHELNDANKENSATWQDNTQAIKDYIKEIKNLKTEMVDAYLDQKNDFISHMTDYELWDVSAVTKQLESMLKDIDDFHEAGLLSYEEYVERYNEITKQIYDSRKDSLEYILDMVEDMIRKEIDDQVDAYEDQKDALNDIIDAKKKIIELTKEENDYNKSLQDKIKEMAKLQERIAQLELDDSREAAAEKATLLDQLAELQDEVDTMQYDNSVDKQLEALDQMSENNEEHIDKEIEQLEDLADNAEYVHDRTIEYIRENWDSLLSELIAYNNMYGDGIDENVTQNWENAKSALQEYRDAAWAVAKEMTTAQAVGGTVNPIVPDFGGTAQDVISQAQQAEVTNLVNQMRANSAKWPTATPDGKIDLQNLNDQIADQIEQITGKSVDRDNNGVWWIDGEKLYDKYPVYHTGGTVGEKKDDELFALLKKGEDVLNEQQQGIAIPLLKAGLEMFNLSEGARSILELLKNVATPNLSMLRDSNESLVYAPEVNVQVTSNGGDADEIADAVKDRVLDVINGTFSKMGVSSKFKGIRV